MRVPETRSGCRRRIKSGPLAHASTLAAGKKTSSVRACGHFADGFPLPHRISTDVCIPVSTRIIGDGFVAAAFGDVCGSVGLRPGRRAPWS